MMNIKELKENLEKIKQQAKGWESSSDGSYESCLHTMGYYKILKQIKDLKEIYEQR